MVAGMTNDSEKSAKVFQQKFIQDAIEHFGSQQSLSQILCLTQQTISKWRDASNALTLSKMIRIAKLLGKKDITITW